MGTASRRLVAATLVAAGSTGRHRCHRAHLSLWSGFPVTAIGSEILQGIALPARHACMASRLLTTAYEFCAGLQYDEIRSMLAASRARSYEQGRDGCCGKAANHLKADGPPPGSRWARGS